MTDPLALVTLAVAAAGGHLGGHDVTSLVAAGYVLRQRSATLVRALLRGRAAIGLTPGPQALTALAASDGQGAVLLNAAEPPAAWAARLTAEHVALVFTGSRWWSHPELAPVLAERTVVLLDEAPRRAVVIDNGQHRLIDLGSHFGLDLVGETAATGVDELCLQVEGMWYTHRALLEAARARTLPPAAPAPHRMVAEPSWTYEQLVHGLAVLLQGGAVECPGT